MDEELPPDIPYPVPDFLNSSDILEISPILVLSYTLILVVFGILTYWMFRAMDHPRLVLTETPDGPRAKRSDVIKYVISMPFLTLIWVTFLGFILIFSQNELTIVQLSAWPYAIVLAVRFLAFVLPGAAHELAKLVPLALIALLILSGSVRPFLDVIVIIDTIPRMDDSVLTLIVVFTFDYVMTAVWYWGWIRWWKPCRELRRRNADQSTLHPDHDRLDS